MKASCGDTHNINEQVLTGRSNIFSSVIETYSPNRPSGKIKEKVYISAIMITRFSRDEEDSITKNFCVS